MCVIHPKPIAGLFLVVQYCNLWCYFYLMSCNNQISSSSLLRFATFPWMYLLSGVFRNAEVAFITYVCINLFISINTIMSTTILHFLSQISVQSPEVSIRSPCNVLKEQMNLWGVKKAVFSVFFYSPWSFWVWYMIFPVRGNCGLQYLF